jgi:cytochrome c
MFKTINKYIASSFLLVFPILAYGAENIKTNSGEALTKAEINKWSVTVYPDGRNLPAGSGTALEGEKIYQEKCVMCHGVSGERGIGPRLKGKLGYQEYSPSPMIALSVGAWPYQTSIFDYIRRAMPHQAPKTLTNEDVYALTAYILNLNDLIDKSESLDRESLLKIEMPSKRKSFIAWDIEEGKKLNNKEPSHVH